MTDDPQAKSRAGRGMVLTMAVCAAVGVATVAITLTVGRGNPVAASVKSNPSAPDYATEEYGRRLLGNTPELLGPDVADPKMRLIKSRLSCGSCHIGIGTEPGTLSLPPAFTHYPRYSARTAQQITIEDRVNECMQRSMNGTALAKNSPEMIAMTAYIKVLSQRDAATGASSKKAVEPPALKTPNRAADLKAGEKVFQERCAACHGKQGEGLLAAKDPVHGYVFPPLWGPDSFNNGAGMHRVLTAARFVKARMPLGKPDLTDAEAYDVAAYFNSQPRPEMPGIDQDYPDRTTKPVDTGYGPFADSFPLTQHQFGPFAPIEAYYRAAKKSK